MACLGRNKKDKKPKKPKVGDVATMRLRSASKLVSALSFLKASLVDVGQKFRAWREQEADAQPVYTKAVTLYNKGVLAEGLANEELGDDISAVKLMYTIIGRWHILLLVSVGSKALTTFIDEEAALAGRGSDPVSEETLISEHERCDKLLNDQLALDAYLQEKIPFLTHYKQMDTAPIDKCTSIEEVTECETKIQKSIAEAKTVITSMRRSMKDVGWGCGQTISILQSDLFCQCL